MRSTNKAAEAGYPPMSRMDPPAKAGARMRSGRWPAQRHQMRPQPDALRRLSGPSRRPTLQSEDESGTSNLQPKAWIVGGPNQSTAVAGRATVMGFRTARQSRVEHPPRLRAGWGVATDTSTSPGCIKPSKVCWRPPNSRQKASRRLGSRTPPRGAKVVLREGPGEDVSDLTRTNNAPPRAGGNESARHASTCRMGSARPSTPTKDSSSPLWNT